MATQTIMAVSAKTRDVEEAFAVTVYDAAIASARKEDVDIPVVVSVPLLGPDDGYDFATRDAMLQNLTLNLQRLSPQNNVVFQDLGGSLGSGLRVTGFFYRRGDMS